MMVEKAGVDKRIGLLKGQMLLERERLFDEKSTHK